MLKTLAIKWTERQAALGLKGKKGEAACFEFFMGAGSALELAQHPEAGRVLVCTATILANHPFPLAQVARWAVAS